MREMSVKKEIQNLMKYSKFRLEKNKNDNIHK